MHSIPVSIFISWKQFTTFCCSLNKTKSDLVEKVTMTITWLTANFIKKMKLYGLTFTSNYSISDNYKFCIILQINFGIKLL